MMAWVQQPTVGEPELAEDVDVGPFCYFAGHVSVGRGTRIWPHVIVGTEAEHRSAKSVGGVVIGAYCKIRELTVIQRGTGDRETTVGEQCMVMDHCHIAHDCVLGDGCTLSPNVTLGGHTRVHTGATLGIGAMTHQNTTIGAYAMVGMGSVVTKDVPPFALVMGNPARWVRWNTRAIEALGIVGALENSPIYQQAMAAFMKDSRRKVLKQ